MIARMRFVCSLSYRLMYEQVAWMVCVWHVTLDALQDCRVFQKPVLKVYDNNELHLNAS
jgi:hypothetical protein